MPTRARPPDLGMVLGEVGGSIIDANESFLRLAGRSRGDLPFRWPAHPTGVEAALSDVAILAMLDSGPAPTWETEVAGRNGERTPVLVGAARLGHDGSRYVAFVIATPPAPAFPPGVELLLAEERERRRIAIGLHDSVGHRLALALLRLRALALAPERPHETELGDVRRLLLEAIAMTRELTFELSSPVLHELGLEPALRSLGEQVAEANGLRFSIDVDDRRHLPSPAVSIVLFRAVRELLLNAVKHARAGAVRVTLNAGPRGVQIEVADDGVGMAPVDAGRRSGPGGGLGLAGVAQHMLAIGGRLHIDSTPGRGATFRLVAPIAPSRP